MSLRLIQHLSRGLRAVRSGIGELRRRYRRASERRTHARRHRSAIEELAHAPLPRRILVLCHGNVCRSPYFAAALRRDLAVATRTPMEVDSAGFVGPGRSVPDESRLASVGRGVSLDHTSKLVTRELVEASDVVIVMDTVQARRVVRELGADSRKVFVGGDFDPFPEEPRVIRDPWKQSVDVFQETFDRIDRCARTISNALAVAQQR